MANKRTQRAGKKMTRMALVNWGIFEQPDIVTFSDMSLFIGVNGTGKTMSMDAVMYTLFGVTDFNATAKKPGEVRSDRRTVTKLVHGSTKDKTTPYLRPDETISWTVLEWFDYKREKYFLCGQTTESPDPRNYTTWRFVIDDCRLEDFKFRSDDGTEIYSRGNCLCKGRPVKLDTFQEKTNGLKQIARALGISGSYTKIAGIIRKTMALNPEANVNKFISESVLDSREGQGEILESLRAMQDNYTEATTELERVEKERDLLRQANEAADRYEKAEREYITGRMTSAYKRVQLRDESIKTAERKKKEKEESLEALRGQETRCKEEMMAIAAEMSSIRISSGLEEIEQIRRIKESGILKKQAEENELVQKESALIRFKQDAKKMLSTFGNDKEAVSLLKDTDLIMEGNGEETYRAIEAFKEKRLEPLRERYYETKRKREEVSRKIKEVEDEFRRLNSNMPVYPKAYEEAKCRLEHYFRERGMNVPVKLAVELIRDIKDPSWQTAIESFLGSRRFYIIVPAEYEDEAYTFIKKEKIYGVSVVMTGVLKNTEAEQGTAASMLEITNHDAKKFINKIIGNIWLADSESQVKEFAKEGRAAITKDGTRSSGYSRSLNEPAKVFYIGKNAAENRLANARKRSKDLYGELRKVSEEYNRLEARIEALGALALDRGKYEFHIREKLSKAREDLRRLKEELAKFDAENIDIRQEISQKEEEYNEADKRHGNIMKDIGRAEEGLVNAKKEIEKIKKEKDDALAEFNSLCAEHQDYEFDIMEKIEEARKKNRQIEAPGDGKLIEMKDNLGILRDALISVQKQYGELRGMKNLDLATGPEKAGEFRRIYAELDSVRFEECREAVRKQKERLRRSLIQNFIARISEQIDGAHREKNKKNQLLSKMWFGQQQYQFHIEPNMEDAMEQFYMIRNELKGAMSTEALTSMLDIDMELNNAVMHFLDVILADGDSAARYADYRNYIKCDMIITEKNHMTYRLSSKASESSNGEQQTPYLIILAVSLCSLYPDTDDTARICLMDEAFAAFSDDRIGQMIEYFRENNFQVIFAAPDKLYSSIARYMDSIIVCTKPADSPFAFYCDGQEKQG